MPMRLFLLPIVAVLLQPISAWADFEDHRKHGVEFRELGEDQSCELVNRAYMRTANNGRCSVYYYQLTDNGKEVLRAQGRFIGRSYHYRFESPLWTERQRPLLITITTDGSVVRDCVRLNDEVIEESRPSISERNGSARVWQNVTFSSSGGWSGGMFHYLPLKSNRRERRQPLRSL